jgi:hypothetical protein
MGCISVRNSWAATLINSFCILSCNSNCLFVKSDFVFDSTKDLFELRRSSVLEFTRLCNLLFHLNIINEIPVATAAIVVIMSILKRLCSSIDVLTLADKIWVVIMNKVRKCLPFTLTGAHVSVFVTPSSNLLSVGLHDPLCKELFKI